MPGLSQAAELRQKRGQLVTRMTEIKNDPQGEDGAFSDEQRTEFDKIDAQQSAYLSDAERIERHEETEAALAGQAATPGLEPIAGLQDLGETPEAQEAAQAEAYDAAFDSYLRYGVSGMQTEQRSLLEATLQGHNQRQQGTNEDSKGGYLVPEGFHNQIIEATLAFGGMRRSRATVLRTASGQPLPIATDDDTANTGAILTENTAETDQDLAFGQVMLNAYMYTSKFVKVSKQLLQDSAFPLQPFISKKLGTRLGRITNTHFTVGDGSSKPKGVGIGLTIGKTGATGQTTSIIYDDLVDLEHSVDPSYRDSPEWMFADSTLKVLKKLKDGEGRPLWLPGLAVKEPDTILSHPYIVNQDVPAMAASAVSAYFGDFSAYYIRDVQDMIIMRLDERFADSLQVAFLAFARHDATLVDAGTQPIKSYVNSAT